ncbi:MAG: cytochrome c oxidase subunit 3 [Actinomycetota bacterium]
MTLALPAAPAPAPRRQLLVGSLLAATTMVMLTGSMLGIWALQRTRSLDLFDTWVPDGVTIPEVPSNVMLVAFVGVGVMVQWAHWAAMHGDRAHTVLALALTGLFGILIINAQAFIWFEMGLGIADGTYQAMFYAITGMFVVLLIIGVLFTMVASFRFIGGREDDRELLASHAIYWYTVAVCYAGIWFVVYVTK